MTERVRKTIEKLTATIITAAALVFALNAHGLLPGAEHDVTTETTRVTIGDTVIPNPRYEEDDPQWDCHMDVGSYQACEDNQVPVMVDDPHHMWKL